MNPCKCQSFSFYRGYKPKFFDWLIGFQSKIHLKRHFIVYVLMFVSESNKAERIFCSKMSACTTIFVIVQLSIEQVTVDLPALFESWKVPNFRNLTIACLAELQFFRYFPFWVGYPNSCNEKLFGLSTANSPLSVTIFSASKLEKNRIILF